MSLVTYLIRIKDQTGTTVTEFVGRGSRGGLLGDLLAFNYTKAVRVPGQFALTIGGQDDRLKYLDLDLTDILDSQVEFWRRDLYGGAAYTTWLATLPPYMVDPFLIGWYKDFEGFLRGMRYEQSEDGTERFIASGVGYNALLAAEPIRYAAGTTYTEKSDPAETVAKEFVNENVGPGATSPPRDRDGVMPGLTIEADAGTGATWSGARANKNLLDVCVELADFAPADYMIIGTGAAAFEFQWRANQWGDDKQLGNTAGNPPVVFSAQYGTARSVTYTYSRLNEINIVDVLGTGVGTDRNVRTVTNGLEADSPWNKRAVARDARDTIDNTEMDNRGYETLNQNGLKRVTTCEALQTPGCRYGQDWGIGDLVTIIRRGVQVGQKIVAANVAMDESGNENISPEMEDLP